MPIWHSLFAAGALLAPAMLDWPPAWRDACAFCTDGHLASSAHSQRPQEMGWSVASIAGDPNCSQVWLRICDQKLRATWAANLPLFQDARKYSACWAVPPQMALALCNGLHCRHVEECIVVRHLLGLLLLLLGVLIFCLVVCGASFPGNSWCNRLYFFCSCFLAFLFCRALFDEIFCEIHRP